MMAQANVGFNHIRTAASRSRAGQPQVRRESWSNTCVSNLNARAEQAKQDVADVSHALEILLKKTDAGVSH